jgi:pimeloyl-ACP methyl ester carboxylesterase
MRLLFLILLLVNFADAAAAGGVGLASQAKAEAGRVQPWQQRFVDNGGVRIEYRVREASGAGSRLAPVVFIPGMTSSASIWENNLALVRALDAVAPRKLIAISLRGRGASDCPDTGWTPQDHQRDIAAVIRAEKPGRYHLVAHSMGVAYAIGFALTRPRHEIRSFIAGDYFPAVKQVNEAWAHAVESNPPPLSYDPRLARHILREQGAEDYASRLNQLAMPMLVILGRKSIDPATGALYAKAPQHRVIWLNDGHMVFANEQAIAAVVQHIRLH